MAVDDDSAHASETEDKGETMSHRDIYEANVKAWENADLDGSIAPFAENAVIVEPGGEHRGLAAIRNFTADGFLSFSSVSIDTTNFLECGDSYVAEWTARMTHSGPMKLPDGTEIPPTGKTFELSACEVGRFVGDKIIEVRVYWDNVSIANQLGLMPS